MRIWQLLLTSLGLIAAAGCASSRRNTCRPAAPPVNELSEDNRPVVVKITVRSAIGSIDAEGNLSIFAQIIFTQPIGNSAIIKPLSDASYELASDDPELVIENVPFAYTSWTGGTEIIDREFYVSGHVEVPIWLSGGIYRLYRVTSVLPPDRKRLPIRLRYVGRSGVSSWATAEVDLLHVTKSSTRKLSSLPTD